MEDEGRNPVNQIQIQSREERLCQVFRQANRGSETGLGSGQKVVTADVLRVCEMDPFPHTHG